MPSTTPSENPRGILFMLATTVGFILSDTFVKLASAELAVGQIIVVRSLIAAPIVALVAWQRGAFGNLKGMAERFIALRAVGEVGATALYLSALAHLEIANSTAIIQTVPLAATAAAALLMGEKVGIRRWSAVAVGLAAVLLIVRPGLEGFSVWSLLALGSVGFIVLRDLASRFLPATTHPFAVSTLSLTIMIPLGLAMLPFGTWGVLTPRTLFYCAASGVSLAIAFALVTLAMRHGAISVVAPFRYAILLWAIVIQIVVFSVWPDALTLIGGGVLVATGLYTLYRERKVKQAGAAAASPAPVARPSSVRGQ
jgi:drug/metabolite transporter (DMT)-like permease